MHKENARKPPILLAFREVVEKTYIGIEVVQRLGGSDFMISINNKTRFKEETYMNYDYDALRKKIDQTVQKGLLAKAISKNTGIGEHELSRFRNTNYCLKRSDAEILSDYLDRVVIPERF